MKLNTEDDKKKDGKNIPVILSAVPDKTLAYNKTKIQTGSNQKKNDIETPSVTGDNGEDAAAYSSSTKSPKDNDKNNSFGKAGAVSSVNDVIIETFNPGISSAGQQHIAGYREPETILAQEEFTINTESAISEKLMNSSSGSGNARACYCKKSGDCCSHCK